MLQRVPVRLSIASIRLYQRLAPARIRNNCRFTPSCSEYAILALDKYGLIDGWRCALRRLLRCKPPHGGEDFP